ncbi:MAG: hypothetical protein NT039_00255 [Candidatus Berkelbacteria bacterium]|nr:hypothetical protein [Candidatus Berkelbacteria bacterium]
MAGTAVDRMATALDFSFLPRRMGEIHLRLLAARHSDDFVVIPGGLLGSLEPGTRLSPAVQDGIVVGNFEARERLSYRLAVFIDIITVLVRVKVAGSVDHHPSQADENSLERSVSSNNEKLPIFMSMVHGVVFERPGSDGGKPLPLEGEDLHLRSGILKLNPHQERESSRRFAGYRLRTHGCTSFARYLIKEYKI